MKQLKNKYDQIIKVTGKALGIDAGYFVKGGIWGMVQQAVGLICGLGIAYGFGHWMAMAVFGEYNLALSIISLVAIVSLPGMNTAMLQSLGKGFDFSLEQGVKTRIKWSFWGIPILIALAIYYYFQGSDTFPTTLLIVAIFFPLLESFQSTRMFFLSRKRFDLQAAYTVLSSVLTAILIIGSILLTKNLLVILAGYLLGQIIPAVLSYSKAKTLVVNNKQDKGLTSYAKFLTALQILPTAAAHLSNIILASLLGVEQLAIYVVATKFPGMVQKNFDVFYKPVTAKLANQNNSQHANAVKTHLLKFIGLGILMAGGIWVFVPFLIRVFYSAAYLESIALARLYAWSLLSLPLIWLFNDLIKLQKRKKEIFVINTIFPVVKLLLMMILIPLWQIKGLIYIILAERLFETIYLTVRITYFSAPKK